jgi:hypothetical protein
MTIVIIAYVYLINLKYKCVLVTIDSMELMLAILHAQEELQGCMHMLKIVAYITDV